MAVVTFGESGGVVSFSSVRVARDIRDGREKVERRVSVGAEAWRSPRTAWGRKGGDVKSEVQRCRAQEKGVHTRSEQEREGEEEERVAWRRTPCSESRTIIIAMLVRRDTLGLACAACRAHAGAHTL